MTSRLIVRLAVAVVFGALFGLNVRSGHVRWHNQGRDAFLASESRRYDHYMATLHPAIVDLITWVIIALFVAGIYEVASAGLGKFIVKRLRVTSHTT